MAHLDAPSMAACMAQDLQAVGSCAFKENLLAHACRCGGGHAACFVPTARYIAVVGKYAGTVRCGGPLRPAGRPRVADVFVAEVLIKDKDRVLRVLPVCGCRL